MSRPKNTEEQRRISLEKTKKRLAARDRRKTFTCKICACPFKMERLHRHPSKWCESCRSVEINCFVCSSKFKILRGTYNFRGAKFCSVKCSLQKTCVKAKIKHGLATKENRKKYLKLHRENNRSLYRSYSNKRRVLKNQSNSNFTSQEWELLKARFNYMCLCCKRNEPEISLTVDHIIPISKGGSNEISNIQPLCLSCNCRKHVKTIDYISKFYENSLRPH